MTEVGQIIFFSQGSYSDYGIHGHAKVLIPFDYDAEEKEYIKETPDTEEPVPESWKHLSWWKDKETRPVKQASISGLILRLVTKGLIEEIQAEEFYVHDSL